MTTKAPITIHDLAALGGVSTSTVSLVLRDSPLVAKKTREKILKLIDEVGYVYNRSAAAMRSQRTGVIAICVNDLANPYFAGLTSSMERALNQLDRTVLLADVREDLARQSRFIEKMREHRVDGLLISPAHATDTEQLVAQLTRAQLPCVLVSRNLPSSGLDYAGYDHREGMRLAVDHLIQLGHTRIALLGGDSSTWVGSQRLEGYCQAHQDNELLLTPQFQIAGALDRGTGISLIEHALALPSPPTAAACANDSIAFGVMLGLRRHGLEPGVDFSITGTDDLAEANLWQPALTSVANDVDAIGQAAAQLLLQRMDDPSLPTQHISLPVHLVVRGSSARPRN